jgi:serine protease AprX
VKSLVQSTAQDRGFDGKDNDWGWGLLDGFALVSAAASGGAPVGTTAFPGFHLEDTVANGATWTHTFEVTDTTVPIALTMLIEGRYVETCWGGWFCFEEWTLPDLDARLRAPDGTVVDTSTCGLGCGDGTEGNQEILTAAPVTAGTWTIEVYPYATTGGRFVLDVSAGVGEDGGGGGGEDPPEVVTVHLAGLSGSASASRKNWTATVTAAVTDASAVPVAGVAVSGTWSDRKSDTCTTDASGTCTITKKSIKNNVASITFTVASLTPPSGVVWDPSADVGHAVTVTKP